MRYAIRMTFHNKFEVFYYCNGRERELVDIKTAEVGDYDHMKNFVMSQNDAVSVFGRLTYSPASDLKSVSVVKLSRWQPYPEMSVLLHKEFVEE